MRTRKAWRFTTLLVLWASVCCSASRFPDEYDKEFERAALHLPAGTDWRLLKAQCYQESRLQPRAVSPVGAVGLCQFMPGTWSDMQERYEGFNDPYLPVQSIRAAAIYMNDMINTWSTPRPYSDRYKLALSSYNAGAGNIIKAQRVCDMQTLYADIVPPCLPCVTGSHSDETVNYVRLIWDKWWPLMRIGG